MKKCGDLNKKNILEENNMTVKRVRAGSARAARKKACGKNTTVTKVNYIKGSKKGRMKTYSVTTKHKKK